MFRSLLLLATALVLTACDNEEPQCLGRDCPIEFGVDFDDTLVPQVEDGKVVGYRGIVVMDWEPVVGVINVDCCFKDTCYPSDDWAVGLQDYDYRSTVSGRCANADETMWFTWVVHSSIGSEEN